MLRNNIGRNNIGKITALFAGLALIPAAEGSARAKTWTRTSLGEGVPPAAHNFTPSLGTNIVTLAPNYDIVNENLYYLTLGVLTDVQNSAQDYNLQIPTWSSNPMEGYLGNYAAGGLYYQGIVQINGNEPLGNEIIGWTKANNLYPYILAAPNATFVATGVTSFAAPAPKTSGDIYGVQTSNHHPFSGGWEIYSATSTALTSWTPLGAGIGAVQVTSDQVGNWPYWLDNNGRVWFPPQPGEWANLVCKTNVPIAFVQIAAKNGVVYGLSDGEVYSAPFAGSCWTPLTKKGTTFLSIATDNAPNIDGFVFPDVWASDNAGNAWIY